jgi:hypothetical protein
MARRPTRRTSRRINREASLLEGRGRMLRDVLFERSST